MPATKKVAETETRIWNAWRALRRGPELRRLRLSILADADGETLDVPQVDTLRMIVHEGEILMGELARRFGIDASTATRAIDQLERRSLVERRRMSDNARFIAVEATDLGREIAARIEQNETRYMHEMLEDFTREELETFADLLERLQNSLVRVVASHQPPSSS